MLGFLCYCRLVSRAALHHSISWAQFIISIIVIIAVAGAWLAPVFGMIVDAYGLVAMARSPAFLVILVAAVVILRLVCAQYWVWTKEYDARAKAESQVAELSARHITAQNTAHNALSVEFLRDNLHEIVQTLPAGTIRRILKLSTLNQGNGWLSNCRLSIEQTAPPIYDNAVELESGFTLHAGERRYSYFLYFDERFPDGSAAPKVLLAHHWAGNDIAIGFHLDQPTIFTLKATSNEARECAASFRAFVGNGRLQIENL
jgi:hypothetical protein